MPFPIIGGVNLLNDSRSIRDDQCLRSKNLYPVKPGVLGKRPGLSFGIQVLRTITADYASAIELGSVVWNTISIPFEGNLAFVAWIDSGLQPSGSAGTALVATGPDGQNATYAITTSGQRARRRPVLVAFNNKIYAFSGGAEVFNKVVQSSASGFEIANFAFSGTDNSSLSPNVAAVYKNRMVYANFGRGFENHLVFSDRYEPQTIGDSVLAANGRNIIVGARDGDRIVAMHEITMSAAGSPAQSVLLVLKEFSGYIIAGEPNESDDTFGSYLNTLEVSKFNVACGCVSPATIADTPFGTIWCGSDDVWLMPPGGVPYQIGTHIRPLLKNQSRAVQYKLFGAYFDGFYRLALFGEGQGPSDDNAPAEHWWLDLRNGAPRNYTEAQWWGPQVYKPADYFACAFSTSIEERYQNPTTGPWAFILENRPSRDKQLYAVVDSYSDAKRLSPSTARALVLATMDSHKAYDMPSYTTQLGPRWASLSTYSINDIIVQLDTFGIPREYVVTTAGTSGSSEPTWPASSTVSDGSVVWTAKGIVLLARLNVENEIAVDLLSKEYTGGDAGIDKLVDGLELDTLISTLGRLQVDFIVNSGASTISTTRDLPQEGFELGIALLDGTLSGESQGITVRPQDGARVFGRTVQFRIQDVPGWIIDSSNNQAAFAHSVQGAKTATLTSGFYQDLELVLNELIAQMNAQMSGGITFSHNQTAWTSDLDRQLVEITISSGTFRFDVVTSGTTRALMNILGFDPSVEQNNAATQQADTGVPDKRSATIELNEFKPVIRVFTRRPL